MVLHRNFFDQMQQQSLAVYIEHALRTLKSSGRLRSSTEEARLVEQLGKLLAQYLSADKNVSGRLGHDEVASFLGEASKAAATEWVMLMRQRAKQNHRDCHRP